MRKALSVTVLLIFVSAIMLVTLPSCKSEISQQKRQAKEKAMNVETLMERQGVSKIDFSMDRYLLKERIERFNDPNKMSYLYVFTPSGPVVAVTIMGKVASTSKRLTNTHEPVGFNTGALLTPTPDEMGVYGDSSGDAKVGITTLGSLIEFGGFGFYIYSEVPISFTGLDKPVIELKLNASEAEKQEMLNNLGKLQRGEN